MSGSCDYFLAHLDSDKPECLKISAGYWRGVLEQFIQKNQQYENSAVYCRLLGNTEKIPSIPTKRNDYLKFVRFAIQP